MTEENHSFVDAAQRYALESRIATGGMGEVWRANDTVLGRPVAVKLLKAEYADDATFRSRFETEARHAASLHHPNVAAVYDFGEAQPFSGSDVARPYLVMELVNGQPLSALLEPGQALDPDATRDLLAQAADALAAAHAAGIVHRDVKPANLLVTPDRTVKITDFGIARAAEGMSLTETGQVMGTPQYLSPEQARGETATPASDVYSLGVVAFECLAGHRPYEAETPVATALAHLRDPVPELPDDVPADLAAVVRRAMAKEPEERFADAAELATALRNPGAVAAPDRTRVLTGAAPAPAPATAPLTAAAAPAVAGATESRRGRKVPWGWILVGALVIAGIIVVALLADTGEDQPDPPAATRSEPTQEPTQPTEQPSTQETQPTQQPSPTEDNTVEVDESDYVGRDVDDVEAELQDLGLNVRRDEQTNPGDEEEDSVEGVDPSGTLEEGDTVTVSYWGPAPAEEPTQPQPPTAPPGQEKKP